VRSRIERERRISELRYLIQAGLYRVDVDRLARKIVQRCRNELRTWLDGKPSC